MERKIGGMERDIKCEKSEDKKVGEGREEDIKYRRKGTVEELNRWEGEDVKKRRLAEGQE